MNLLLVTEYYPRSENSRFRGGVQARTFAIGKALSRTHSVEILSLESGEIEATASSLPKRLGGFFKILSYRPRRKPDLIEASNAATYLPAFLLARRLGVPVVAWVPDLLGPAWKEQFSRSVAFFGRLSESLAARLPWDRVIAMSQATRAKLINAGFAPRKIDVVYGGVDCGLISRLPEKKFVALTICTIARLVGYKKLDDLLRAFGRLSGEFPSLRLLVIGAGPEKDRLEALADRLKLRSRIEFTGSLPHRQALALLKRSHLFCLPSLIEGFGLVTVEALAAGVPFVNSDIPATREITRGGQGGILYPPGDYRRLASGLKTLLTDAKLYRRKRAEGLKLARAYDWELIAKQTLNSYNKAING